MSQEQLRSGILLTLQAALLGEVSETLRGVTCSWSDKEVKVRAIFDCDIAAEDKESMECVVTEVMASFPEHDVQLELLKAVAPEPLNPLTLTAWVYRRREPE